MYSPVRKEHMRFFVFDFWHFKPIDSTLYSGAIKSNFFFFQILERRSENGNQTQKIVLKCFWNVKMLEFFFYIKLTRNCVDKIGKMSNFDYDSWKWDHLQFFAKGPWFWHIWIAQWLKFFVEDIYFFSILTIFRQ